MASVHSLGLLWSIPAQKAGKPRADSAQEALEIVVLWAGNVLSVHHSCPPRSFVLGDGSRACDFVLPEELGVGPQRLLCSAETGSVTVTNEQGEAQGLAREQPRTVKLGQLSFRCTLSERDPTRFPASDWDRESLSYFGASLGSVLALVAALGSFALPLGITDEDELDRERLQTMLQILHAQAEREQLAQSESGASALPPSPASEGATGAAGTMGKPTASAKSRRFASTAPAAARDTTASRAELLAEAQNFGLVQLLRAQSHPGALWERDGALNPLDREAFGGLFGTFLDESAGTGGLAPSGPGQGSGGPGVGVGVGSLGTCQTLGGCRGGQDGFGRDATLATSTHATTTPRVRPNGNPDVSGVLPAELVQRVVRQNFGRFRNCYEDGLRRNPSLSGRVTARFVIDRAGAVSLAQNGGSDLPDSSVVSCVLSAFYGLSFPAPDNGVVRVSYPILFSVG